MAEAKDKKSKPAKPNKVVDAAAKKVDRAARRKLLEELFYDFHANRWHIYKLNLFRGLFFGLGTVLGGTLLVAVAIAILGQFEWVPFLGDFIQRIIDAMEPAT